MYRGCFTFSLDLLLIYTWSLSENVSILNESSSHIFLPCQAHRRTDSAWADEWNRVQKAIDILALSFERSPYQGRCLQEKLVFAWYFPERRCCEASVCTKRYHFPSCIKTVCSNHTDSTIHYVPIRSSTSSINAVVSCWIVVFSFSISSIIMKLFVLKWCASVSSYSLFKRMNNS